MDISNLLAFLPKGFNLEDSLQGVTSFYAQKEKLFEGKLLLLLKNYSVGKEKKVMLTIFLKKENELSALVGYKNKPISELLKMLPKHPIIELIKTLYDIEGALQKVFDDYEKQDKPLSLLCKLTDSQEVQIDLYMGQVLESSYSLADLLELLLTAEK